eukprot:TRINITY_DN11979_c1_g7_i2.p1 TRINITY_DN11979_c1_g7~~TRINITY_DN11979_c1_g7_i2.p1  ORF type:complete len:345 (+),score=17.64 TRINITY_DN11979_c1_g7_i2:103-1137(+)
MKHSMHIKLYLSLCIGLFHCSSSERLLTPGLHSGLGNQATGLLSAIKFAKLTSRMLVLPPILAHHAVAFGLKGRGGECDNHSLDVFHQLEVAYGNAAREKPFLCWSDLFEFSDVEAPTIRYTANDISLDAIVAKCGTNPTQEQIQSLIPSDRNHVAIASAFKWSFSDAKLTTWSFPLTQDWRHRFQGWQGDKLWPSYHGMHIRICDPIVKQWRRGFFSKAKRNMKATNLSATLDVTLSTMANSHVYVASDLKANICAWPMLRKLISKHSITCIDEKQLKLDPLTAQYVSQGHAWLPSFVSLVWSQDYLRTVAMSHDCTRAVAQKGSTFALLLERTQQATRERDS